MVSNDIALGPDKYGQTEGDDPKKKNVKSRRLNPDTIPKIAITAAAVTAAAIIFFIIIYIAGLSIPAFQKIGIWDFVTGDRWSPSNGHYGALPLITGTILVTAGSIIFAVPLGVGAAIYISEVASEKSRNILKPVCEIFAGIPSVVYGFFGLLVLCPLLLDIFPEQLKYSTSWLAGSILLGIMALPTVISVSEDAIRAVPKSYRHSSLAMGATGWETTTKVVLPAASSGVIAASILGIGRAMGETMAVIMVTGNSALIPDPIFNIFSNVRTLTATVALEMPEVVYNSVHYSSLFAVALLLLVSVIIVNLFANAIGRRTRVKLGIIKSPKHSIDIKGKIRNRINDDTLKAFYRIKPLIRTILLSASIFVLSSMMISLFIANSLALIAGGAITVVFIIGSWSMRFVRSSDKEAVAHGLLKVLMFIILMILVIIIGDVLVKGIPALSTEFIFGSPSDSGRAGGIWPAIVGTLELVAITSFIALPLGIGAGIYLSQYARDGKFTQMVRNAVDALNGTPSIVFGLFGMSIFVIAFGWGTSVFVGSITLAFMILPVIIKTTEEAVSAVPKTFMQASMAMGSSKWQAIYKVILPAAIGGVITGIILSLGRAAGETAPIMFTAVLAFSSSASLNPFEPVMALPYHLYFLATEVTGSTTNQYGTAVVLLLIVLSMFLVASLIRHHYSKNTNW
ncbi:MAG TPA: phosphate ABC transporter permease PstA [Candidatus Methanomethylophilaceae archaeon]|nr:phosphate ABC transporter permease PstA [Candidatus Methanomethylophilaceae archaeon]